MVCDVCGGPMIDQNVTYTIEFEGQLVVVENVPAKACTQCGERLFAPAALERLLKTVWQQNSPKRVMQTPVFDFAESRS